MLGCAPSALQQPTQRSDHTAPALRPAAIPSAAADVGAAPLDAGADTLATPQGDVDAGAALPLERIVIEQAYKLYERPRPKGKVAAAGADETLARWNVGGSSDPNFVSSRSGYHPGARVRVDTRVLAGRLPTRLHRNRRTGRYPNVLSETSLLARSRKYGYWPFRICFEDGLRENQELKGKTAIRMTIDGRGRVSSARLSSTKLEDPLVAQCLVDRSRGLTYPPPPRGRSVRFEMTVALWPGDAPVSRIGPPRGETHENPGQVDEAKLRGALEALLPDVARCYAAGLAQDPGLWGRLAFRLDLSEQGKLGPVREYESRFPDRNVRRCVARHLRRLALGVPKGGALSLVVAYRLGSPPEPASAEAPADAGPAAPADAGPSNARED